MDWVVTPEEMRALDRIAIDELGIPSLVLMENAGRAVAEFVRRLAPAGPVLVLAGVGNNGGDGLVVARVLAGRGEAVTVWVVGDEAQGSPDFVAQLAIARKLGLQVHFGADSTPWPALFAESAVLVDALFGTGLTRPIGAPHARVIEQVNASEVPVVAIDLPSGLDGVRGQVHGVAIQADYTVCLAAPKIGLLTYPGRALAGEISVVDIGIPEQLYARVGPRVTWLDESIRARALPPRPMDSHKGDYGHLMIVAGTPERPGSSLLAGRAALRMGTGLVTLASCEQTIARVAAVLDELMGLSAGAALDSGAIETLEAALAERKTALLVGPSLGAPQADLIRALLARARVPAVIDAGALDAYAGRPERLAERPAPSVLTPHPGEMGRLIGLDTAEIQRDRLGHARRLAERSASIVVLKGASTLVVAPNGEAAICTAGNPGMASGGMGDVLAGVIGALLAQGVEAFLAAAAGTWIHADAADRAAAAEGEARLLASDVIARLLAP